MKHKKTIAVALITGLLGFSGCSSQAAPDGSLRDGARNENTGITRSARSYTTRNTQQTARTADYNKLGHQANGINNGRTSYGETGNNYGRVTNTPRHAENAPWRNGNTRNALNNSAGQRRIPTQGLNATRGTESNLTENKATQHRAAEHRVTRNTVPATEKKPPRRSITRRATPTATTQEAPYGVGYTIKFDANNRGINRNHRPQNARRSAIIEPSYAVDRGTIEHNAISKTLYGHSGYNVDLVANSIMD